MQTKMQKLQQRKTNNFMDAINKIADLCEFDPSSIISCCQIHKISSIDFTLNKFQKKSQFVIEFCQKKCNISLPKANLIKLWTALNAKYNLSSNRPYYPINTDPSIWISKSFLVYFPKKSTKQIIDNGLIREPFMSTNRLYQYLNWTIRINKINKFIKMFRTSNGIEIMIINSELHNKNGQILYILSIKNDIISRKSQQWQFVKLCTAQEIMDLATKREELLVYGYIKNESISSMPSIMSLIIEYECTQSIHDTELPVGARLHGQQFNGVRTTKLLSKCLIRNMCITRNKYKQLKGVRTGYDKRQRNDSSSYPLSVTLQQFSSCINKALYSNHPKHELVPIVSILTGKKYPDCGEYSVDQLLPVQIGADWIGIVYRNGQPVLTLIDGYDITNKAILCDPAFDKRRLEWFTNNITKIEICSSMSSTSVSDINLNNDNVDISQFQIANDNLNDNTCYLPQEMNVMNKASSPISAMASMASISPISSNTSTPNNNNEGSIDYTNTTNNNNMSINCLSSDYGSYQFINCPRNHQQTMQTIQTSQVSPISSEGIESQLMLTLAANVLEYERQADFFAQFSNSNQRLIVSPQSSGRSQSVHNNVHY